MLQSAVNKHHDEQARSQKGRELTDLFSSSPPKEASQQSASQYARNALAPAPPSALNGAKAFLPRQSSTSGVKRTSSGLAKSLDGTFDDPYGSQHRPIPLDNRPSATQYDENDFDSDVDLEIEEPTARSNAAYPTLPTARTMTAPARPVVYPQLPQQRPAYTGFARGASLADSGYGSMPQRVGDEAPQSSTSAVPWSSSPAEHMIATLPPRSAEQQPGKRRKLPWANTESGPEPSNPGIDSRITMKPGTAAAGFTPLPKDGQDSKYPWNTTASAVKEQQRNLKEQTRKVAVKKNAGTEESRTKAKTKNARPARVFLSEEQQHVLELVTEHKKSAFFTGSAGTGKSVLLREIIAALRRKYQKEPDRVAVTASTGLAACNVGGVTLHSFAGIGLGKEEVPELVRKIKRNQKAKHRWMRTKILVVDEVSMVDADLFDKLEAIARQLRNNGRPFGGIQLVITGDFFQLPPVPDSGRIAKFAFDAATWNTTIEHTIGLHHVFRQKDPVFAGMLNEMREGRLTPASIAAFRNLNRDMTFEDALVATELFPTRTEVDRANSTRLGLLQGQEYTFPTRDGGAIVDKAQRDKLLSNCMAPESIILKKGAQVMLIKNVDESLVNGSLGKVIGFMDETKFDSYSGNEASYDGSPGGTLASSANNGDEGAMHEKQAQLRSMMMGGGGIRTSTDYPVVRFTISDGTTRDLLCTPETWKVELPNGEVQASRNQVPLILAWALSIHKAQGQTLDRVKVDLGKVFEKGQAYVALSRATSMAGLQVLRFDPKKVVAHERVRTFYSNLSRVELAEKNRERMGGKKVGMGAEAYERRFVDGE